MNKLANKEKAFIFLLMPEFTLLAFSSAVEALRMANAAIGYDVYTWKVVAPQGDEVQSSCGVQIHCDSSVAALRRSVNASIRDSTVIVCGGLNIQTHSDRATESWLREYKQSGCMIGSLCTGAYILGQAKLLGERKCVIHWENAASFGEQFHDASVRAALFEIDNGIATCAGGMAAFDMMLYLIQQEHGEEIVAAICERAIVDRIRNPGDRQRSILTSHVNRQNQVVTTLIERMQESLTDPIPVKDILSGIGLTRRQVERIFQQELHISPAKYYMKLRLERARLLLHQTNTPIVDIAMASGFSSASHFSKAYRDFYGHSPHRARKGAGIRKNEPDGFTPARRKGTP